MSFKLLLISTMYTGSLNFFYGNNKNIRALSYNQHLDLLLETTTEFVGSYLDNFKKLGLDASAIIANDKTLQDKWEKENGKNNKEDSLLTEQVRKIQPNVLWIDNLSLVSESWLNEIRKQVKSIILITGYHCSPVNSQVLNSMKGIDILITCTPGLKEQYENVCKKTFLSYHAFDPKMVKGLNSNETSPSHNLVFSGSLTTGGNFHNDRIRLIEKLIKNQIPIDLHVNLENGFRIKAKQMVFMINSFLRNTGMEKLVNNFKFLEYGKTRTGNYSRALLERKKPPVFGLDMYNLFNYSKIVLNYHIGVAGDFAGNMRMFEVTGIGSCLLTDNKKNMSELFNTDNEVVVYDNANDCVEKVKWLLDHEEERKNIALAGQKRTLRDHTVEIRCRSIIEIIKNELKIS